MSATDKEDLSQIFVNCQAKLVEIDDKLSQIKSRYKTGRIKHKYSLHTNEDFIILKKETESLESDIQFVKTLLEETTEIQTSFPVRLMKKVFPTKMFSQNKTVSNEIKAKIIAHSTALLEEKVKVLQTIAASKKKKKKPKRESIDSVETVTTNSLKPASKLYKPRASSDSEIFMNPHKISSLKILNSLKKQQIFPILNNYSSIETTELKPWNLELRKYSSSKKSTINSNLKKSRSHTEYNFVTYSEQHVQTMETWSHLSCTTTEKYAQTDFPLVTWFDSVMNPGITTKKYAEKETNTDIGPPVESSLCVSNNNHQCIKDFQHQEEFSSTSNILDINEIDNIINSLLYSPLKMLQCKHISKLGGNNSNPPGYVNLIIRQSDFMPLLVSGIEERKKKTCKQYFPENCICFAYSYHVKYIMSQITLKYDESYHSEAKDCDEFSIKLPPTADNSIKVEKTEFSVQYKSTEINNMSKPSNTLQIDYKNPLTSGRIILTEFGESHSSAQSEMISRILTHLIGIPNSKVDYK